MRLSGTLTARKSTRFAAANSTRYLWSATFESPAESTASRPAESRHLTRKI